jgi:hypothetical protein
MNAKEQCAAEPKDFRGLKERPQIIHLADNDVLSVPLLLHPVRAENEEQNAEHGGFRVRNHINAEGVGNRMRRMWDLR